MRGTRDGGPGAERQRQRGLRSRLAVYKCILQNPGIRQDAISKKVGLGPRQVHLHVKAIREGWRPGL